MAEMDDTDWGTLLRKIKDGECTPFLGAGACFPVGMLGGDIAEWLSRSYHYPWKETRRDLARVAQYVAAKHKDRQIVVGAVRERFFGKAYPWYKRRDEPHAVLAQLPLPLYITTNYDDFMRRAFEHAEVEIGEVNVGGRREIRGLSVKHGGRKVRRTPCVDICRWFIPGSASGARQMSSRYEVKLGKGMEYVATVENPLVYHLHGVLDEPQSMVLTEDDYTDFLVKVASDPNLIPGQLQDAFRNSTLLFLGYSLSDPDLRVILRYLQNAVLHSQLPFSVAVQLAPRPAGKAAEEAEEVTRVMEYYLGKANISVKWCDCHEFAGELRTRWEKYLVEHAET